MAEIPPALLDEVLQMLIQGFSSSMNRQTVRSPRFTLNPNGLKGSRRFRLRKNGNIRAAINQRVEPKASLVDSSLNNEVRVPVSA